MYVLILPAVAQVGLVGVEHDQAFAFEKSQGLGAFAVVLVNFGQAIGKLEMTVKNAVMRWYTRSFRVSKELAFQVQ